RDRGEHLQLGGERSVAFDGDHPLRGIAERDAQAHGRRVGELHVVDGGGLVVAEVEHPRTRARAGDHDRVPRPGSEGIDDIGALHGRGSMTKSGTNTATIERCPWTVTAACSTLTPRRRGSWTTTLGMFRPSITPAPASLVAP